MNPLDLLIIATMVFFIVRGVFRGFFREIGSLAGVIFGIWIAAVYHHQVTEYLKTYIPTGKFLPLISLGLIFFIVLVLCNLAGLGLKMMMKRLLFGWADRGLGVTFAILKGIILTYFVIVLLTFFVPSKAPLIARSKLAPLIISSYQSIVSFTSPGSYQKWKQKFLGEKTEKESVGQKRVEGLTQ
ncbi:MAG: CvpA family protein [Desulfobacteraceae bacterium]|nr:MAG: CvpA family protein [Desulfobacteraceae bacterium]